MKKKLSLILAAVMLLSTVLCACGETAPDAPAASNEVSSTNVEEPAPTEEPAAPAVEPVAEGKELTVRVGPDPLELDPALCAEDFDAIMLIHLFEGLLTVNENVELAEGCAETWETSEDGLTWTFHLRDGLKWSDGSPLTAEDFVYSWKRVADPATRSPYAETLLLPVKGYEEAAAGNPDALCVSAPDERTFVVELSIPCTYFGSLAAFPVLSPVQRAAVEANDDWALSPETLIGNGAFRISEWVPGSHIVTVKNPDYWNADAVKLDSIRWLLIDSNEDVYRVFSSGEALFCCIKSTESIPASINREEFHINPIIGTLYLSLNNAVEPLDDPLLRKALSLSIDRQYFADTLMRGAYVPAWNFIGPGWLDPAGGKFMENANGGETYISDDFEANLAEAKALMQEAGYAADPANPDIHLTYSVSNVGEQQILAEYLREAWAEIGVDLEISVIDLASATQTRRDGDYEISRNGWVGDYNDPSNQIELMYSTNGNNDGNVNNADLDAALDLARDSVDPAVRSEALHRAEDIIMDEMMCIPVVYFSDGWLQNPTLQCVRHTSTGLYCFIYADIAE